VIILAGDHVYKMNYQHMFDCHERVKADLTVAFTRCPLNRLTALAS
jgi:glucose-1-phosphate adenylyltransferase